jgi:hypothetical protein
MKRNTAPRLTALAAAALLAGGAQAVEIDIGNPDWSVRWDNSLRLSSKYRTESADPALKDSFRQVPTGAPGDRWDANGQLWKTLWAQTIVAPDLPGSPVGAFGFNDLISGQAFVSNLYNTKSSQYVVKPRFPEDLFTPDSLAGSGVR